jgi:hypothetical protein
MVRREQKVLISWLPTRSIFSTNGAKAVTSLKKCIEITARQVPTWLLPEIEAET